MYKKNDLLRARISPESIVMDIQWLQVCVCIAGLAIPVGVLVSAAADTVRAEKGRGKDA